VDPLLRLRRIMDEEDIRNVASAVVSEYPRLIAAVDDATDTGDRSGMARIAHNFKGSGASLELEELHQLGREVEHQARTASAESLRSLIGNLKREALRAVRLFRDYLEGPGRR
jgi:HPt (histidine-containing phosphotransfer) domain-containing protein